MNRNYNQIDIAYNIASPVKKDLTIWDLLEAEREHKYIVAVEVRGKKAIVALMHTIPKSDTPTLIEVDLNKLYEEANEAGESYLAAREYVCRKLTVEGYVNQFRLDEMSDGVCLYYIPELNRFIVYSWAMAKTFIEARYKQMEKLRPLFDHIAPSYNNTPQSKQSTVRVPPCMNTFVNSIKIQKKSVKITYGKSISRLAIDTPWEKKLKEMVGRTPGSTVGGIIRRIRTGSLVPKSCQIFSFEYTDDSDKDFAIMTLAYARGGQSFLIPIQSLDMYKELVSDKFDSKHVHVIKL